MCCLHANVSEAKVDCAAEFDVIARANNINDWDRLGSDQLAEKVDLEDLGRAVDAAKTSAARLDPQIYKIFDQYVSRVKGKLESRIRAQCFGRFLLNRQSDAVRYHWGHD